MSKAKATAAVRFMGDRTNQKRWTTGGTLPIHSEMNRPSSARSARTHLETVVKSFSTIPRSVYCRSSAWRVKVAEKENQLRSCYADRLTTRAVGQMKLGSPPGPRLQRHPSVFKALRAINLEIGSQALRGRIVLGNFIRR